MSKKDANRLKQGQVKKIGHVADEDECEFKGKGVEVTKSTQPESKEKHRGKD
ncbi:hypothetical protein [Geopsychrobacter electrodiphilus]|uniref:hypothetical protein n=1 Tax=Geopsychrobacter electrodiphilus TaxID=225196 RepID=UPI00036600E4|nr:hypothetical protein [Geopsychrobacter electrodiphilus]